MISFQLEQTLPSQFATCCVLSLGFEQLNMDKISPERRSANMRAIRSQDTKPELQVRRLLHSQGYRYRLHRRDLPGKPDLVFSSRKSVIFIHGCFWHAHSCGTVRLPKSNSDYWFLKLRRNSQRDAENLAALEAVGWRVLTVWECELKEKDKVESKLRIFLGEPKFIKTRTQAKL